MVIPNDQPYQYVFIWDVGAEIFSPINPFQLLICLVCHSVKFYSDKINWIDDQYVLHSSVLMLIIFTVSVFCLLINEIFVLLGPTKPINPLRTTSFSKDILTIFSDFFKLDQK